MLNTPVEIGHAERHPCVLLPRPRLTALIRPILAAVCCLVALSARVTLPAPLRTLRTHVSRVLATLQPISKALSLFTKAHHSLQLAAKQLSPLPQFRCMKKRAGTQNDEGMAQAHLATSTAALYSLSASSALQGLLVHR